MKPSDLNIKLPKEKDKRGSSTVPTTPLQQDKTIKLGRIRSLGKIDLRSPIINHTASPGLEPLATSDDISLYTSKTQNTISSRLLTFVPDTLYSIRHYYNDFTTIDWANAFIKTNKFQYELHHKHWITTDRSDLEDTSKKIPLYYRTYLVLGRWVLIVLIGFVFSLVAYGIDKTEIMLVGLKHGYCRNNWFLSQVSCCSDDITQLSVSPVNYSVNSTIDHLSSGPGSLLTRNVFKSGYVFKSSAQQCPNWVSWSVYFDTFKYGHEIRFDFLIYVMLTILLAVIACIITLSTEISGRYPNEAFKEADQDQDHTTYDHSSQFTEKTMYTAAGSGVPEVRTILSGFVIRRFLGTYTFVSKSIALVLAIASGMSLGKEGPYVHLATCVGNILSRFFPFVSSNEVIQKQILSAAASSGVALAFGSPLGGVLFILEEINHSLPSFQLFQIFFCAIISTLFLKFLDPYNTGNTVLFELSYTSDWTALELVFFVVIGVSGGVFGSLFVKFVGWWPKVFRQLKPIKNHPVFEVVLLALLTGIITFWNPYTKQATTELVLDLATPCTSHEMDRSLCPSTGDQYVKELGSLLFALIVKIILTAITFGAKLPIGIYVPSMVIGALFGRFFGVIIEWANYTYSLNLIATGLTPSGTIPSVMKLVCKNEQGCIDLGIYAMISAGAFMAGVTRMNITLVTILFEITSSYTYVLPISIAIAVANWIGGLIEPNSLYESLLIANDYPFMAPETEPIDPFTTAGEVVEDSARYKEERVYDSVEGPEAAGTGTGTVTGMGTGVTGTAAGFIGNGLNIIHKSATTNTNTVFLQPKTPVTSIIDRDVNLKLYIDITSSPYVPLSVLKQKNQILANKTLLDGCIALVSNNVCIGLMFFSELEFCIDRVEEFCRQYDIFEEVYCKVHEEEEYFTGDFNVDDIRGPLKANLTVAKDAVQAPQDDYFNYGSTEEETALVFEVQEELMALTDFTNYVNYHPIFLNYNSELSLAHLVFDKIGTRVIVLLKHGKYYGVLHKKALIDFIRREK